MKKKLLTKLLLTSLSTVMLLSVSAQALTTEDALELVEEYYLYEIPEGAYEATDAATLIDALGDIYSYYLTAEDLELMLQETSTNVGLGITVNITTVDNGLLIDQVSKNSPASEAGLKAGDLITAVDNTTLAGLTTTDIFATLSGDIGTTFTLTVLRNGAEFTTEVTIGTYDFDTTSELLDDHICYIYCPTFDEMDVAQNFEAAFESFGSDADRWIVDLTSNGGGYIDQAALSAVYFTGSSTIASLYNAEGELLELFAPEEDALTLYPVVVMVSNTSASSSEIYAAAVRDLNAGLVVGERTYGKGIAQAIITEENYPELFDGDGLQLTYANVFSPSGNSSSSIGVIPHILVDSIFTEDIAILLSESNPTGDTSNLLRINYDWRWYVDLDKATSEEYLPAFTALLEALPSTVTLWQGLGDISDWEATSVETLAATYGLSITDRSFTDTADSTFAKYIDLLATYNLLEGTGDGTFSPTDELTRGQLCSMLAWVLNCDLSDSASLYSDVSSDHPYSAAITAMTNLGLVNGISADTFCPDDTVTLEQLVTVMGRMAESYNLKFSDALLNCDEEVLADPSLSRFSDWSKSQVWLIAQSQSINLLGVDSDISTYDPSSTILREQFAGLLYNFLYYTGILPI